MIRRFIPIALLGAVVLLGASGCSKDEVIQIERFFAEMSEAGLAAPSVGEFMISLNGDEAGVTTLASGTASLAIGKSSIDFTIELNNIGTSVQTVSLYLGEPGEAGAIAATLFSGNQAGPINGVLAEGTLVEADIQDDTTLSAVVAALRAGQAYVLVATTAQPTGELRGQSGPRGQARFLLSGSRVDYAVEGQIISEVTSAGIYSGRTGTNGPLRVSLFEGGPTGTIDRDIAVGEFGASDIDGLTLSQLMAQMRNGDAYVLVTTSGSPNGKMRGQVFLQFYQVAEKLHTLPQSPLSP